MKNLNKIIMSMMLVLAMVLGALALAEATEVPTLEEVPAQVEATETPAEDAATDDAALQDALNAYREAQQQSRQEARLAALEDELKGYVEAGKLTQEQADLILNDFKARAEQCQSAKENGKLNGKGGRMNGGMGQQGMPGNGGMGGRMNGGQGRQGMNGKGGRGMGGYGMMGPQSPNSAYIPEVQPAPEANPDGI